MRPSVHVEATELYECPDCGERAQRPDSRYCPACETTLRRLDYSRDL